MDTLNPSSTISSELLNKLSAELQKDFTFKIYHLCTPRTRTSSLYSKPPGQKSGETTCSKHFFAASINPPSSAEHPEPKELLCYAVEIFIYFTTHNTTLFVSKADSTGYLNLLKPEKKISSPLRTLTTILLQHLVNTYQQPNIHSIISLFARAQDQYLFPRSVEYAGKHVLDDRSLIRWWCDVLNPIVEDSKAIIDSQWETVKGYMIIPGLDAHETLLHSPKRSDNLWTVGHPLLEISGAKVNDAPKFLIPQFPDDPKARFLEELDEETIKCGNSAGQWKSIKTLDQFWEMMAFRQECSAGRLVGFLWVVFSPASKPFQCENKSFGDTKASSSGKNKLMTPTSDEFESQDHISQPLSHTHTDRIIPLHFLNKTTSAETNLHVSPSTPKRSSCKKRKLTGKIIPRRPHFTNKYTESKQGHSKSGLPSANTGSHFSGQIIVDEAVYNRLMEFLLHLDFSRLDRASSSSKRWIEEVRCAGWGKMKESWGQSVTGSKVALVCDNPTTVNSTILNSNLVRKKRKTDSSERSCQIEKKSSLF